MNKMQFRASRLSILIFLPSTCLSKQVLGEFQHKNNKNDRRNTRGTLRQKETKKRRREKRENERKMDKRIIKERKREKI